MVLIVALNLSGSNKDVMATNHQTSKLDFSYLAVILLLAYVLASAPKFVRQIRQEGTEIKLEKVNPFKDAWKIGKAYTIDPYLRAFNAIRSSNYNPFNSTKEQLVDR
jgi:hypothetical protein